MATPSTPSTTTTTTTTNATSTPREISILFVCLGNICRSPMAHAVFSSRISSLPDFLASTPAAAAPSSYKITQVDSAGTGAYHAGAPPDPRTQQVLEKHDIVKFRHSARKVTAADFDKFDLIVGMDGDNVEDLLDLRDRTVKTRGRRRREEEHDEGGDATSKGKVVLFGAFGGKSPVGGSGMTDDRTVGEEVIDPYYGGQRGFDTAFEQCQRFTSGLLEWLEEQCSSSSSSL